MSKQQAQCNDETQWMQAAAALTAFSALALAETVAHVAAADARTSDELYRLLPVSIKKLLLQRSGPAGDGVRLARFVRANQPMREPHVQINRDLSIAKLSRVEPDDRDEAVINVGRCRRTLLRAAVEMIRNALLDVRE